MSNISQQKISQKIYFIREHKVMIDSDLADLYEVKTGALNRAVQRNSIRFPVDFMFQLTDNEIENLRCQFGISKRLILQLSIGNKNHLENDIYYV